MLCDSQITGCCKAQTPKNTGIVTAILSISKIYLFLSTNKMLKNGLSFASYCSQSSLAMGKLRGVSFSFITSVRLNPDLLHDPSHTCEAHAIS